MPGLRSLVARRRSTLASPHHSPSSITPPPPSTSSVFYRAQKIERRCNSLPEQVSFDACETGENSKLLVDSSSESGTSNGFLVDSRQIFTGERQNGKISSSPGAVVRPSEGGSRLPHMSSSVSSQSSNSSSIVKSNSAMEIESTLARRGVTVVRRMVDADESLKCSQKEVIQHPLKDSVITANPLITKEISKSKCQQIPKHTSTIPVSSSSYYSSLSEQSRCPGTGRQGNCPSNPPQELYERPEVGKLHELPNRVVTNTHRSTGQSHAHTNYEAHSISPHFSAQSVAAGRIPTIDNSSQREAIQSYYSQRSLRQDAKQQTVQHSPSNSAELQSTKGSPCANNQVTLKAASNEMSVPLSSSVLSNSSIAQYSPQSSSASYLQSKAHSLLTASPLSKSNEVSPQSKPTDMSPYSRSSEASPSSRPAQVSPHSRSQVSPLSKSVKVSPHSRSADVSPQSRAQNSPLMRTGEVSPKTKYVGLSPQSNSLDSPQSRPSGHPTQLMSSVHQNASSLAVNPSPLHTVGHPLISGPERLMGQALPMNHTSQVLPTSSHQQGASSRLASSSSSSSVSFTNASTSEFLGRSMSDMFPLCNSSEAVGFPGQLNSGAFGMHSSHSSFLSQGNTSTFPNPSLSYSHEGTTPQFPSINTASGMVSSSNSMGFGNLSNCSGFPLHEISGLYGSHSNPGVYNIHNNSSDMRTANHGGVLNYVTSRDYSMHTPYRDFTSYSNSSQLSNSVRSQEISNDQRDILPTHNSRDTTLQNCNQLMSVHPNIRNSSLGAMGREVHSHPSYTDQHLQPGYRESSLYQRSSSDIQSLSDSRESAMLQNYRESSSSLHYKVNQLSNSYRGSASHPSVGTPSHSSSYREHPTLANTSDYQSSSGRSTNSSNFREQPVIGSYREQGIMSNYLSAAGAPVTSGYRETNAPSNSRDQVSSYRDIVNHASPSEHNVPIAAYQDAVNVSNPNNTVCSNYPDRVNLASPEDIPSRYREPANHSSPGEHISAYGDRVSHRSNDVMHGFQEMRSPTGASDSEVTNVKETVDQASPRNQITHSYQHSANHTSPRQNHNLTAFKENLNQIIPVEQSIPSYQGSASHPSPREQTYPVIHRDRSHGFRDDHTSPRQVHPPYGEGLGQISPRKALSGFRDSIEHPSPNQHDGQGFKESVNYRNIKDTVDYGSADETSMQKNSHDCGSDYGGSVSQTSVEPSSADNFGELQGLQNFRVLSQQRSPNSYMGASTEIKIAALPSFTESFENASHNKMGTVRQSAYKDEQDISYYNHNNSCGSTAECERSCGEVSYEKLVGGRNILQNPTDGSNVGVRGSPEYEFSDSVDRTPSCCNDRDNGDLLDEADLQNEACSIDYGDKQSIDIVVDSSKTCMESNNEKGKNVSGECTFAAEVSKIKMESSLIHHGASPEMISNQRECPLEQLGDQHGEEMLYSLESGSSPNQSAPVTRSSSEDSPDKLEQGESSGKSSLGASPSSQERIVIKMKLLHSKPDDEVDFCSPSSSEAGFEGGSNLKYPLVKYTRWTIDSIINGREDGILSLGAIKKEKDNIEEDCSNDCDSPPESMKRQRKRRASGMLSSCKVSKFDTNKNLMKKSLKITITNPLRARVLPKDGDDIKPLVGKCEGAKETINQEPNGSFLGGFSDPNLLEDTYQREMSSLRRVRKDHGPSPESQSPSSEEQTSFCSASRGTRAYRKQNIHVSSTSELLQPCADDEVSSLSGDIIKKEVSSLRKIRKDRGKSPESRSPSSDFESHVYSSSAHLGTRVTRKQSGHPDTASESLKSVSSVDDDIVEIIGDSVPRMKKCSIVIKRIYTTDNYSCYSSQLCDKNGKEKVTRESLHSMERGLGGRPKRKAAIEANERRHKSLRSFDRSLDIFNTVHSERVPYNGPIGFKYKHLLPLANQPLPTIETPPVVVEQKNPLVVPDEKKSPVVVEEKKLPVCSVMVCDIFMNRRINKMNCPNCSRKYSSDSVQVNLKEMLMSLMCSQCQWEVVKHIKPHEVGALEPR